MRLLSRTVLSPKQQVLLLQVGRRVIVVGDGGAAGMRPLCEITDPDEVAALVGDAKSAEATAAVARSRSATCSAGPPSRSTRPTDGRPAGPRRRPTCPATSSGLLDKVRGLRQQFDR